MAVTLDIRASTNVKEGQFAVPLAVANKLGIVGRRQVRLALGSRSVPTKVGIRRVKGSVARCHPKLFTALSIPRGNAVQLKARSRGGNVIRLGPVIGIFTSKYRGSGSPFGQSTEVLEYLCRVGRKRGFLVYVFTPRDIRWQERCVLGYEPTNRGWVQRSFPFPDAVYDRVPSRTAERRLSVRRTRARLISLVRNRYFNRGFFDKWRVHRMLCLDPRIRPHLPETERYYSTAQVCQLLEKWNGVWIKPTGGSLGKGIVIVRKRKDNSYVVYRSRGRGRTGRVARNRARLHQLLKEYLRHGPYVAQQELNLARFHGRPFDIRLLMQRDGQGSWRRTKLYTRVARGGNFVTNISQGGEGLPFGKVVAGASGSVPAKADEILAKIRELADIMVTVIEQRSGETLGEIALDLGIDEDGKVWFIEANSKPFRAVETRKGNMNVVRRALVRPLLYAAYLSGFGGGPTGVHSQ